MQLLADQAKAHILVIKAMPGHLHVESTPSNVVAQVDGKDQPTHTPLDLVLAPGKHALHLTAPGTTQSTRTSRSRPARSRTSRWCSL